MEIVSPAGNFEKLKIAIEYGADALYGGVSNFSLRQRSSKEFTYESFKKAIDYTHLNGKKFYVTANNFLFNSQVESMKQHIKKVSKMNPDAFIVSSVGIIKMCKDIAPNIPIHLSTQANALNYLDIAVYKDLGVSRIIAAREASLKDLINIKQKLPEIKIEMFVHGSMCFAFSGRCLISSFQKGRVSNKGSCSNDCRFPYRVYVENEETKKLMMLEETRDGTYIFNAKDLNLIGYIDKIVDSKAVDSIKIEGRTKSPYYVAITTKAYKGALLDYYNNRLDFGKHKSELTTLKNRGFSRGYVISRPNFEDKSQNLEESIRDGNKQVCGFVLDDGKFFVAKATVKVFEEYEIVCPDFFKVKECKTDIGTVYKKGEIFYIKFYILEAKNKKTLDVIHSGDINCIRLPVEMPKFTFFRKATIRYSD